MTESTAKFSVSELSAPCRTWNKIFGDLETSDETPLIVIHGGPGACHDYLLQLSDLAPPTPLIFYDQIRNGRLKHLPEKAGDGDFWTVGLFHDELDNIISHLGLEKRPIDVFGHSWGGMLAAVWAATPSSAANLRRLVISSSLASMEVWRTSITSLTKQLPKDVLEVLRQAGENKDFERPEYEAAVEIFYRKNHSLAKPWPSKEVQADT